jgi:hypothetical protein
MLAPGYLNHEFLGIRWGRDKFDAVDQKERPGHDKASAFVTIRERVILGDASKEKRGPVKQVHRCAIPWSVFCLANGGGRAHARIGV